VLLFHLIKHNQIKGFLMEKKNETKKAPLQTLTHSKKEKAQVAQCCAKTSVIVAGCHD